MFLFHRDRIRVPARCNTRRIGSDTRDLIDIRCTGVTVVGETREKRNKKKMNRLEQKSRDKYMRDPLHLLKGVWRSDAVGLEMMLGHCITNNEINLWWSTPWPRIAIVKGTEWMRAQSKDGPVDLVPNSSPPAAYLIGSQIPLDSSRIVLLYCHCHCVIVADLWPNEKLWMFSTAVNPFLDNRW